MNALAILTPACATPGLPLIDGPRLEVFDSPPLGNTIIHAATDNRNAPLIMRGDIVVAEYNGRAGWYPTEGGLFLIEYVTPPEGAARYEKRGREIVQTFKLRGDWWTGPLARRHQVDGQFFCIDGPYRDFDALAAKLIGPVIGILANRTIAGRA